MIPWIQVYSNLPAHPKVSRLAEALKLKSTDTTIENVAVGLLIRLWSWAIQNAYNGDLSGVSDRAIAEAAGWRKSPETFVKALKTTKWLDDDMKLHDWDEYAVLYIDKEEMKKAKTAERVKRYRDKQKDNM